MRAFSRIVTAFPVLLGAHIQVGKEKIIIKFGDLMRRQALHVTRWLLDFLRVCLFEVGTSQRAKNSGIRRRGAGDRLQELGQQRVKVMVSLTDQTVVRLQQDYWWNRLELLPFGGWCGSEQAIPVSDWDATDRKVAGLSSLAQGSSDR